MRTGGPGLWLHGVQDGHPDGHPRLFDKNMGPFAPITLTQRGSLFYRHRTGLMDVYTVPIDPVTGDVRGEPANAASSVLGSNLAPDWSPDGKTLVFASWRTLFGPGQNILVFHSMETGQERELSVDVPRVNGPRWSPGGHLIAIGGPGRDGLIGTRLIEANTGSIVSNLFVQAGDMPPVGPFDWAPDGRHAYFKRHSGRAISRKDVVTGDEAVIYEPPPGSGTGTLCVSPDGRWLATVMVQKESARLIAIPTAGGAVRDLADLEPGSVGAVGWTRDGKHVFLHRTTRVGEKKENYGELWIAPFEGGPARSLALSMRSLRDVRVSPAGDRIAFTSGYPDQGMWVFDNFLPQTASTVSGR
jgi:Tol biopolymer transport system component